jgi:hypothetical protein
LERVELHIQIGERERRVNARRNVTIQSLLNEIRSRFGFPEQQSYVLLGGAQGAQLETYKTLAQHALEDGDRLVFQQALAQTSSPVLALIARGERMPLSGVQQAYLREESRGQRFALEWQPAILGRPYQMDPARNRLLAVNLNGLEGAETVSRHHACIIEQQGQFILEPLNARNPVSISQERLEFGARHVLQPGDRIRLGRLVLVFHRGR